MSCPPTLTENELYVLQGIARGDTNQQIALRMKLSVRRIEDLVASIGVKFEAPNRTSTAVKAALCGLVSEDE